jgi:hypothetical protein
MKMVSALRPRRDARFGAARNDARGAARAGTKAGTKEGVEAKTKEGVEAGTKEGVAARVEADVDLCAPSVLLAGTWLPTKFDWPDVDWPDVDACRNAL